MSYKRICFIYTETTGLHQTHTQVSKKELFQYARLVVLNYMIGYVKDKEFVIEQDVRTIIKPRCIVIPKETEQYHGISQEKATLEGTDIEIVLNQFKKDIMKTDVIVSHNIDFHLRTIISEAVRYNIVLEFGNYIIVDTISFYHNTDSKVFIKLKDLAVKLKLKNVSDITIELIRDCFLKLYSKYKKSLQTA